MELNRRDMIRFLSSATISIPVSFSAKAAWSQEVPDLDIVFSGQFIEDPEIFIRLRRSSAVALELRGAYDEIHDYVDTEWLGRAFVAWRLAYGTSTEEGLFAARSFLPAFLGSNEAQAVTSDMQERLDENLAEFAEWASSIGVSPDGRLFSDIILGQAGMGLLYVARTGEPLSFFDDFTWIWPFC